MSKMGYNIDFGEKDRCDKEALQDILEDDYSLNSCEICDVKLQNGKSICDTCKREKEEEDHWHRQTY